MSLPKLTENLNIIQSLPDQVVNQATEIKRKWDESGNKIKEYINNTLLDAIENEIKLKPYIIEKDVILQPGQVTEQETNPSVNIYEHDYPEGFTNDNCIPFSIGMDLTERQQRAYNYGYTSGQIVFHYQMGILPYVVTLKQDKVRIRIENYLDQEVKITFRIMLLKIGG